MNNQERYKKYIEEHCKNCKHKDENLCEIRISTLNKIVTTKCVYYENTNGKSKKKPIKNWQKW